MAKATSPLILARTHPPGPEIAKGKHAILEALRSAGPKGYWLKVLEFVQQDIKKGDKVPASVLAAIYTQLGERDEAFKWLELAFSGLPPGGARSDVAQAMTDVAAKMTRDELDEAKRRERQWKARPEGKAGGSGPN